MQKKENSINLKESSDEKSNNESNNSSEEESKDNFDIDCERLTLIDIRDRLKEKRAEKKNKSLLLEKKRKNPNIIISYDSSSKNILNKFCPSIKELNDFLNNCEIEEIDLNKPNKDLISNSFTVFDHKEYMRKHNINKTYLSLEDSQYIQEKTLINPIVASNPLDNKLLSKPKNEKGNLMNENLRKILNSKVLDLSQKKWLNKHIKEIIGMPLKSVIIKGKKLEVIFDLDNTLIFSLVRSPSDIKNNSTEIKHNYNSNNKVFSFSLTRNSKILYTNFIFRKGISDLVKYIEGFCNFHIRTQAMKIYAEKIIEKLEKFYEIKIKERIARDEFNSNSFKSIKEFNNKNINNSNTIILDDNISVWDKNDYNNIIQSKFFFDKAFGLNDIENPKKYSKSDDLLNLLTKIANTHGKFSYNSFNDKEKSWKEQTIIKVDKCPFYQYKEQGDKFFFDFYNAEYSDDTNSQLIYLKEVIKIIYYLIYHDKVPLSETLKLIRLNIFYEKSFCLRYVSNEDEGKNILSNIIQICGGNIVEPDESISYKMSSIYFVCSMKIYEKEKKTIENERKNGRVIVNEKYILNCYYFMTDLELDCYSKEYDPRFCQNY